MPAKATDRRRGSRGFSLVELLVVVFLIGLSAALVVLSLPGDSQSLSDDANRLAVRIAAARDEAVLGARPVAVTVTAQGYRFERRTAQGWEALTGRGLQAGQWESGTRAVIAATATSRAPAVRGEEPAPAQQRISFDNSGLPSGPAEIVLARGDASSRVRVSAMGEVERAD